MNKDKIKRIHKLALSKLNKEQCSENEAIAIIAEILNSIGASILGRTINPPSIDELNKMYYSNPNKGVACMITALHIMSWLDTTQENKESK